MLHLKSTALLKDTVQKRQIFCISIFIPELRTLFLSLIGVPEEARILRTLRFATNYHLVGLSKSLNVCCLPTMRSLLLGKWNYAYSENQGGLISVLIEAWE